MTSRLVATACTLALTAACGSGRLGLPLDGGGGVIGPGGAAGAAPPIVPCAGASDPRLVLWRHSGPCC